MRKHAICKRYPGQTFSCQNSGHDDRGGNRIEATTSQRPPANEPINTRQHAVRILLLASPKGPPESKISNINPTQTEQLHKTHLLLWRVKSGSGPVCRSVYQNQTIFYGGPNLEQPSYPHAGGNRDDPPSPSTNPKACCFEAEKLESPLPRSLPTGLAPDLVKCAFCFRALTWGLSLTGFRVQGLQGLAGVTSKCGFGAGGRLQARRAHAKVR